MKVWKPVAAAAAVCWTFTLAGILIGTLMDPGAIAMAIGGGFWAIPLTGLAAVFYHLEERNDDQ